MWLCLSHVFIYMYIIHFQKMHDWYFILIRIKGMGMYCISEWFLAHLSRRLEWAIVIAHRPSSVRPSGVRPASVVVVRKLSHFQLLLQNRLMDFDETWYAWSTHSPLQVLLFFGQIRQGADPGRGKNRSRGVPFFKKLLLQTGRLQRQTECIAMT